MVSLKRIFAALGAAVIVAAGGVVSAHDGATGVVKERMDLMKSMGGSMKALKDLISAPADTLDRAAIGREADNVETLSRDLAAKFPEGSMQPSSEASLKIWMQWDQFNDAARDLTAAAERLTQAAETGDRTALRTGFAGVGQACGGCHRAFREKK